MLVALTAAFALYAQAAPDAAQAPAAVQAPTPAEAAAAPNGKTIAPVTVTPLAKPNFEVKNNTVSCHNEQVLGSMFPKKVCGTKTQFEQRQRDDQEQVREMVAIKPLKSN